MVPGDSEGMAERQAKSRVSWLGLWINLPLGLGKIVLGWLGQSQALVADGVHSLSDLLGDIAVLVAIRQGAAAPDVEHPYGHGRFETLATVFVAVLLLAAGAGIAIDALFGLFKPERLGSPGFLALGAALASLLIKEALYRRTMTVARRTRSALLAANAWHHRSDALSSGVALLGILGAMAGLLYLDAVAAIVIAAMLGHVAWRHGWPALQELVDTGLDQGGRAEIAREIMAVPGVRGMRQLRTRQSGPVALADVAVFVDPLISISEAHRISEAVSARLVERVDAVTQVVVHVEPAGHADSAAARDVPLRPEIEAELDRAWAGIPAAERRLGLRLDYLDQGVEVTAILPIGSVASPVEAGTLEHQLASAAAHLPHIQRLHLQLAIDPDGSPTRNNGGARGGAASPDLLASPPADLKAGRRGSASGR